MSVAVVGSGFSGIAAAQALVGRGFQVSLIDVGERLDERRTEIVRKFRDLSPAEWPASEFELIDSNPTLGRHRLPKKVHFGSEYIYANDRPFAPVVSGPGRRLPYPTFARGGYSTIWGAAVLPPDSCDMTDWPISRGELEPFLRKAAQLIPLSGGEGNLDVAFPSYKERLGDIDPGPQGSALLEDLHRAEPRLSQRQTLYGRARLAIHTEPTGDVLACNGCGYCFTGCVRGSIFSTETVLDDLMRRGKVEYRPGLFVDAVSDRDGAAAIDVVDTDSAKRSTLLFDAVFLAAGPLNTTRILLRSGNVYDQPVTLKESKKFIVPVFRFRAAPTALEQPSVTMASVFLETKVPELSEHWVHAQVIPMNALMMKSMPLPGLRSLLGGVYKPLLRRMMAAWCGMHSDHSAGVELRLRNGDRTPPALEINIRPSDAAQSAARLTAKHLRGLGLSFGSVFLDHFIQFAEPGSGTHCGGSFPMRQQPVAPLDTDTLGRPFGWSRVFAVDASVLPSIPGTTLAFAVMANAYRIGTLAPVQSPSAVSP